MIYPIVLVYLSLNFKTAALGLVLGSWNHSLFTGPQKNSPASWWLPSIFIPPFFLLCTFRLVVPLDGLLVRLRSDFAPKIIHLDDEGNTETHARTMPVSIISIKQRVRRNEVSNYIDKPQKWRLSLINECQGPGVVLQRIL